MTQHVKVKTKQLLNGVIALQKVSFDRGLAELSGKEVLDQLVSVPK